MMPLTVLEKTDKPRIMCNEVYGVEKKNCGTRYPSVGPGAYAEVIAAASGCRACGPIKMAKIVTV